MINKTTAIALKLFAIYLIFCVLISIPTFAAAIWRVANMESAMPAPLIYASIIFIPTLVLASIAIWILWKTANSISHKGEITQTNTESLNLDKLFQYAISLMGLYYAINALLTLPQYWFLFQPSPVPIYTSQSFPGLIAKIAQLLFGLVLIAKPRQWMTWLRTIGTK
jgi:hypothetical protein